MIPPAEAVGFLTTAVKIIEGMSLFEDVHSSGFLTAQAGGPAVE